MHLQRFLLHLRRQSRAQALVEMALLVPVLVLLIAGIADVGRAFYFKIATTNVAREAGHWAILLDRNTTQPPTDDEIAVDITQPSQESFGINLSLAPLCSVGLQSDTNCPGNGSNGHTIRHSVPPVTSSIFQTASPKTLQPNTSWLFIYPSLRDRTAMTELPHSLTAWREVGHSSKILYAPDPSRGGVQAVLNQLGGSLRPVDAEAASGATGWCYAFNAPTLNPTAVTIDPGGNWSLAVSLPVTNANPNPNQAPANDVILTASAVTPGASGFTQQWTPPNGNNTVQALLNLTTGAAYTVPANADMIVSGSAGTYTFQVTAHSVPKSGFSGCSNSSPSDKMAQFTVTINAVPTPAPSGSDFSVSVSPAILNVQQGSFATAHVFVDDLGSFNAAVALSANAPNPPGAAVTTGFSSNPIPPSGIGGSGSSVLTFTASSTALIGTYTYTITATSGAISHAANITVNVVAPAPVVGSSAPPAATANIAAHQITITVIYYMTPITPGLGIFSAGQAIYVVGTATLEGTY